MKDYANVVKKKIRRDKMVREIVPFLHATIAFGLFFLGMFTGSLLEEWEMLIN